MCNNSNSSTSQTITTNIVIPSALANMLDHEKVFTHFDVTKFARSFTQENIRHDDVRNFVDGHYLGGNMQDYNREFCELNLPSGETREAFVYFPDGSSASDHDLVSANTGIDLDDDSVFDGDTDGDTGDTALGADEYRVQASGRFNVPKKLLDKITIQAGSYDLIINSKAKSVVPNRGDDRNCVRITVSDFGITSSTVMVTVNVDDDTISINGVTSTD